MRKAVILVLFLFSFILFADNKEKHKELQWSSLSSKGMNWNDAAVYCKNLKEGGKSDWRLPDIDELRTLIKNCSKTVTGGECKVSKKSGCLSSDCWKTRGSCFCDYKGDNHGYYSKLGDNDDVWLWSSSTVSLNPTYAWSVGFSHGNVGYYHKPNLDFHVRCVR